MPNLILGRFAGERIRIAVPPSEKETEVWVTVAEFRLDHRDGNRERCAKLAIEAPRDVAVDREELWQRKQEGKVQ
jgi:sRNA-binding carbon storage regulator CsrA